MAKNDAEDRARYVLAPQRHFDDSPYESKSEAGKRAHNAAVRSYNKEVESLGRRRFRQQEDRESYGMKPKHTYVGK